MSVLQLLLTNAGVTAIVDAEAGGTNAIVIEQIGLTASAFVLAPTLTGLPGEFKRIDAVSGEAVDDRTVHLTMRDDTEDTYTVRGFGLYLADGTLFAVYGQADKIFEKAAVANMLLALDVRFEPGQADLIQFGDANFLYPPATEIRKGVAEIATQAEADAGTDDERIISPKKLASRLAALLTPITDGLSALLGRTIMGGGLATGGGDLTANRTITVTAASAAEADAGSISSKALVPSSLVNILASIAAKAASAITISGAGLVTGGGNLTANRTLTVTAATGAEIAAGTVANKVATPAAIATVPQTFGANASILGLGGAVTKMGSASGAGTITFPVAFPNTCDRVLIVPQGEIDNGDESDENWWVPVGSISQTGFQISVSAGDMNSISFGWVAWGH